MGVLNVTPDSFFDGGQSFAIADALQNAQHIINQGADIIDVGGESTRPNAMSVASEEELKRVIPVVKALAQATNTPISIDTSKPKVMIQAVKAGASIINDVYALRADGALEVVSDLEVDICLMHMQGVPKNMQVNPVYDDVIEDIKRFFANRIESCITQGINENRLILDPGFGFGKTLTHNIEILQRFNEFKSFGLRLLAGLSRKSMIGEILNKTLDKRLIGSVIGAIIAINHGADIVRVHDVAQTRDAITMWSRIYG